MLVQYRSYLILYFLFLIGPTRFRLDLLNQHLNVVPYGRQSVALRFLVLFLLRAPLSEDQKRIYYADLKTVDELLSLRPDYLVVELDVGDELLVVFVLGFHLIDVLHLLFRQRLFLLQDSSVVLRLLLLLEDGLLERVAVNRQVEVRELFGIVFFYLTLKTVPAVFQEPARLLHVAGQHLVLNRGYDLRLEPVPAKGAVVFFPADAAVHEGELVLAAHLLHVGVVQDLVVGPVLLEAASGRDEHHEQGVHEGPKVRLVELAARLLQRHLRAGAGDEPLDHRRVQVLAEEAKRVLCTRVEVKRSWRNIDAGRCYRQSSDAGQLTVAIFAYNKKRLIKYEKER
ncbi:Hypothetical_protein [Hexamita inflata]|uniref:Hypothetical_protein n=1 Tax=Hexamita inflata TaxID=28002 RepID=A0AA86ND67_9EUKA|nr:Hypothetical protein HINF_LOCUS4715 [Hexamita inflata]